MDVFLIRHAAAGSRTFGSHDRYRQLSDEGKRQADQLADFFASEPLAAVYSSPATRCVQTVESTAGNAGLTVLEHDDLWEDVGLGQILALIDSACHAIESGANHTAQNDDRGQTTHQGPGLALCSHGNLIPAVVEQLAHQGIPISGRGCERASIWKLQRHNNQWVDARYLTPRSAYQV